MTLPGPLHEAIPLYEPGSRITAEAMTDIEGGRFVQVDAARPHVVGLNGNVVGVGKTTGALLPLGVSAHDAKAGEVFAVIAWGVIPVTTSAAITAGSPVATAADGLAAPGTAADSVGLAINTCDAGEEVFVRLTI